jgi:hypothetical protein
LLICHGVHFGHLVEWTRDGETDAELWAQYGIVYPVLNSGANYKIGANDPTYQAEIEELTDNGIHLTIAAGNHYVSSDLPGGVDYDNIAYISGGTYYYNRPGGPYSKDAFYVGNIDTPQYYTNGEYKDYRTNSSVNGLATNIYAPGCSIVSAMSTENSTTTKYPYDNNYKIASWSGTSMASPQVCGVCALYLSSQPNLTVQELQEKMFAMSKPVLVDLQNGDYSSPYNLNGSHNRMLFSKFNSKNKFSITKNP